MQEGLEAMRIAIPMFECLRCGHRWSPRKEEIPRCCGFCKTPYWNVAANGESVARERHGRKCPSCRA